ncbi:MAG: hypothetical protein KAS21_07520, partial [Candidatus Aminicenantes bacterium]|nr:hypothetical protein [Candidatus Aminicenantes bacterium]
MNKSSTVAIKFIALLLVVTLFHSGFELNAFESSYETNLSLLVKSFKQGKFKEIIPEIEKLLNEVGEENSQIRGRLFLLLGASYEKIRNKD